MKALLICLFATTLLFGAESNSSKKDVEPTGFKSTAEAIALSEKLFAGGKVHVFDFQETKVLILQVFGSGVYDLVFMVYAPEGDGWKLLKTWSPELNEPHQLEVIDGGLFVISGKTQQRWEIFRPETKEASQPSI